MRSRLSLYGVLIVVFAIGLVPVGGQQPPPNSPTTAGAQNEGGPGRGARGGRGGGRGAAVRSPEVAADQRVTFRLRAPNAKEVAVSFGGNTRPMQRDDQGVWSVTTEPLAPNFYTYSLVVDGTPLNDPGNRQVQTSWNGHQSMFVVPGTDPWFPKAGVPRGGIARHGFASSIAGDEREFFVYTPPGYDPRRSRRYPLLFLLHGLGDDAERWLNGGAAPVILDNLIGEGKAVPMVVVTTLGYGTSQGPNAPSAAIVTGYERILMTEVLPLVEKSYHVSTNRDERGIAGLSMGGAESIYTALNNLDRFAWVGSFSGAFVMWPNRAAQGAGRAAAAAPAAAPGAPSAVAPGTPAPGAAAPGGGRGRGGGAALTPAALDQLFPTVSSRLNSQLKLLWISCGTADGLLGVNRTFKEWLRSKNVRFYEEEAEGVGHVWPLWRQDFTNFAQRAFK
jgi:enterochelin esterase family protein